MNSMSIRSLSFEVKQKYRNDPKFSDRYVLANSADPDQTAQSDQGHTVCYYLHRLDSLLYGRATKFKF